MNKRYDINMEVLTPLTVGAGNENEWIRGVDYVVKNGKVYILDLQKAVVHGTDIDCLSKLLASADEKGICELLGNQLDDTSRYIFCLPALSVNPIKSFLRSQFHDKPLVAGSSLKGALRSILFSRFRQDEQNDTSVLGSIRERYGTDFMQFIQVGDIEMQSTSLVNTRLFNLWKERNRNEWHGGWKHANNFTSKDYQPSGFNTLYECIPPGQSGRGTIKFSADAFETVLQDPKLSLKVKYADAKKELLNGGIESLFGFVNDITWDYLLKEKEFFEHYKDAERTDEILEFIEDMLDLVPKKNSYCILKMSAGSGFHSITGDWKYDDFIDTGYRTKYINGAETKIPLYKSRKIVEYNKGLQLMGFVKLSVL